MTNFFVKEIIALFEVSDHSTTEYRKCHVDLWKVSDFPSGIPISSTNKTDIHDITEILLKVTLNTINQTFLCSDFLHPLSTTFVLVKTLQALEVESVWGLNIYIILVWPLSHILRW
jgi:hypothetical protein